MDNDDTLDPPQSQDPQSTEPQIVIEIEPPVIEVTIQDQENSNYIKYNALIIDQKQENRTIVTQCFMCDRPLGSESRDLGFWTCHDHRNCSKCNKYMQSAEIQWCYTNNFPLTHARCVVTSIPKDQMGLDLMNMFTKLIWPDPTLSPETNINSAKIEAEMLFHKQSLDEAYLTMRRMQACAAAYSFLLSKDKSKIEKDIGERESKKLKDALAERDKPRKVKSEKTESTSSTTSVPKVKMDADEKAIQLLMKNAFLSREVAVQTLADMKKSREQQYS